MRHSRLLQIFLLVLGVIAVATCGDNSSPTNPTTPTTTTTTTTIPPTPPPAVAALESITLSATTVTGQVSPTATVKLTAPAPSGNAPIILESSNPDVAKVPSNISVAAGQTSNSFAVNTSTVNEIKSVTIFAKYLDVTQSVVLTVLPPTLEPRFSVTSASRGGDFCAIVSGGGAVDCTLDASASSGFVARYRWTVSVAGKDSTFDTPDGTPAFIPATTCAGLSGGSVSSNGTVSMQITLKLEDRQGNLSSAAQRNVELAPNAACGY